MNPKASYPLRLDRFLSTAGVCARRKVTELIKQKQITINGYLATEPSLKVYPEKDTIKWNKKTISLNQNKWYIAFYKPKKVLTTMSDPKNRPCIADYFKKIKERIYPIGRLDWHSEGLILLTNDGHFAMKILKQKPPKTYLVKLNGHPTSHQLSKLKKGIYTQIGKLKAVDAKPLNKNIKNSWVKIILEEGQNRQLHRMFEKLGLQIKVLKRVAIGKLKVKSLKPGTAVFLSPLDIKKIFLSPLKKIKKNKIQGQARKHKGIRI